MIKEQIQAAVTEHYPEVSMTITARPVALDSETVLERVLLIAAKRHVPIHHVIVQEIDGRTSVSFDVEIDSQMTHGQAHEIVSGLEIDVRQELGSEIEVDTHMEPLEPHELPGQDAPDDMRTKIAAALVRRAQEVGIISDVHNVRVRETPAGLVVNYHCRVDPNLSVENVHDHVDDLDRMAQADFPTIVRIVGHAEPVEV
jgi:divalent metal cation (Fe/Co/Zn/Cd) transporter